MPSARSGAPYGAKTRLTSCIASFVFSRPMITWTPPARVSTGTSCCRKSERCRTSRIGRSFEPSANSGCSRTLTMPSVKTSSTTTESASSRRLRYDLGDVRRQGRQPRPAARNLRSGEPAELDVQRSRRLVERGLVERRIRHGTLECAAVQSALHDVAVTQHEDEQPGAVRQRDELHVAEPSPPSARRRDDRGRSRAAGQDARRQAQPVVARQLHLAELVTDHEPIGLVQLRLAHERLDVEPIAEVGRARARHWCADATAGRAPRAPPWRRGRSPARRRARIGPASAFEPTGTAVST